MPLYSYEYIYISVYTECGSLQEVGERESLDGGTGSLLSLAMHDEFTGRPTENPPIVPIEAVE